MRRAVVLLLSAAFALVLAAAPAPAHAQQQRFTGMTSQDAKLTLTVGERTVRFAFAFSTTCGGEPLRIPIEGTATLTETGAFLDEGEFASGSATYRIEGNAPTEGERTGTVELRSTECKSVEATWRAQPENAAPAPARARSCPDPRSTASLTLDRLRAAAISCTAARTAATRWARACYVEQWVPGGTRPCRFTSGGRTYTARMRITGPPGSGGLSRITLTSGKVRVAFDARVRGSR